MKNEENKAIRDYISTSQEEMISLWRELVNTQSPAREKDKADAMCRKLKEIIEGMGFECLTCDVGNENGMALYGIWGKDRKGKPIVFSGHYDTVSLAGNHTFTINEDGHAHGLGCLDMKGGIVVAIYVIKALQSIKWSERPIVFLFVGDEEKGHQQANTPDVIMGKVKGAACAFNMETGLLSNEICIGRKGGGVAEFTVKGVDAHAGNDFLKGRNAIAEMAHKILDLQALTDLDKGTTVTVSIIKGGTVPNSIPPECSITVDLRYETLSERERIKDALSEISKKVYIDGCKTVFKFDEYMPPFETTQSVVALANFVSKVSEEIGLGKMGQTRLGGGSDASYIGMAKVPVVCSMGVRGEFNHTDREYAVVTSLFDRTNLLANLLLRINEFAKD